MTLLDVIAVLFAGIAAGTINTVVGSGTLITFPTLLAVGLPPVTANVTNTIALVPGSLSGAWGYRAELRGQGPRILRYGSASVVGGIAGAVLLLTLPKGAFDAIVPVLIGLGVLLVVLGPRIKEWALRRAEQQARAASDEPRWTWPAIAGTGVYGGYFGAAQGIILLAILGLGGEAELQRDNALKNVLAALVNGIAAAIFAFTASINWRYAALVAAGAIIGGLIGARVGRRLPENVLRGLIVVVGVAAIASFIFPL